MPAPIAPVKFPQITGHIKHFRSYCSSDAAGQCSRNRGGARCESRKRGSGKWEAQLLKPGVKTSPRTLRKPFIFSRPSPPSPWFNTSRHGRVSTLISVAPAASPIASTVWESFDRAERVARGNGRLKRQTATNRQSRRDYHLDLFACACLEVWCAADCCASSHVCRINPGA